MAVLEIPVAAAVVTANTAANAACPQLQRLTIVENYISEAGIGALARALGAGACRSLLGLDIAHNEEGGVEHARIYGDSQSRRPMQEKMA